jgi:hypothetical protein
MISLGERVYWYHETDHIIIISVSRTSRNANLEIDKNILMSTIVVLGV